VCRHAMEAGREDFSHMLTLIRHTGLRLHECARLDTATAAGAVRRSVLTIKGKGGKVRDIPANEAAVAILDARLALTRRGAKLFVPDDVRTDALMQQLEQFVYHQSDSLRGRFCAVRMTVHGLRHTYAAERYAELIGAGHTAFEARKQVPGGSATSGMP